MRTIRRALAPTFAVFACALGSASSAAAQEPALTPPPGFAPPPPAGYAPPPAGYAPPPAGYAPPPGYAPAPGAYPYPYPAAPMSERDRKKAEKAMIKGWNPDQPVPPGFHVEERMKVGLVVGGAVMAGLPWFFSAVGGIIGATASNGAQPGWSAMAVPVLGPFITLGTAHSYVSKQGYGLLAIGLVFDGLIQAGGAAMFITGITSQSPRLVRDAGLHVMPTPMRVGDTGNGLGLVGTF